MLARHKCLKVFPELKSVYFPPSSLHFSLCWGQLPLSQHMIAEALRWNTTLSHDAGPVTGLTVVSLSSMSLWRKGVCIVFASKSPVPLGADQRAKKAGQSDFLQTSHALEKGNRSVPGPSQSAYNTLSLFGQRCVCKRDTPSSSLYWGCGLCGEMYTSGVRNGNRFQSLHLTKDMLDINLAGWHQHEKWDLVLWEVLHKFQMTGENTICFHSCPNQYLNMI